MSDEGGKGRSESVFSKVSGETANAEPESVVVEIGSNCVTVAEQEGIEGRGGMKVGGGGGANTSVQSVRRASEVVERKDSLESCNTRLRRKQRDIQSNALFSRAALKWKGKLALIQTGGAMRARMREVMSF